MKDIGYRSLFENELLLNFNTLVIIVTGTEFLLDATAR